MLPKVILNLSALDYGGAGKYAVDFNQMLLDEGHESYLIVRDKKTKKNEVRAYPSAFNDQIINRWLRKSTKKKLTSSTFDYDYYFYDIHQKLAVVSAQRILKLIPKTPQLIFIHWVTDFINAKVIGDLAQLTQAKIYWLMLDNSPITGGCHYTWACRGYQTDCRPCPAIHDEQHQNLASENLAYKLKHLPRDISLIAFSETDYQRANRSLLFKDKSIIKMIGMVDERRFRPDDKVAAKQSFNFRPSQRVVFCGAASLKERRKGMSILWEAIQYLNLPDVIFLIAGNYPLPTTHPQVVHVRHLEENQLIKAYQAADVFVCPSLEDSGPLMINQALMCGTPVVAFAVGVAEDLVIPKQTGYLAHTGDAVDLAKGIASILELPPKENHDLAQNCRTMAISRYGISIQRKLIMDLLYPSTSLVNHA